MGFGQEEVQPSAWASDGLALRSDGSPEEAISFMEEEEELVW